jgi:hypothetical protein
MPARSKLRRGLLIRRRLPLRRPLIRRRSLAGRPLIGLSLELLSLVRLSLILLLGAPVGLSLILLLRVLALALALVVCALALASALLHLRATRLAFLLVLVLLIGGEHAQDLAVQFLVGVTIDGAARRVRLRVLVDHRLNALLLISGEIQVAEALHPAMLDLCPARRRMIMACACARLLALLGLLSRGTDRCGERRHQGAHGQEVDLHGMILAVGPGRCLNLRLGPGKRFNRDGIDRVGDVPLESLEIVEEELR